MSSDEDYELLFGRCLAVWIVEGPERLLYAFCVLHFEVRDFPYRALVRQWIAT